MQFFKKGLVPLLLIFAGCEGQDEIGDQRTCKGVDGLKSKVRIFCTDVQTGVDCLSTDGKPFMTQLSDSCGTRKLKFRYKLSNKNDDVEVRVNTNTKILYNGKSIFTDDDDDNVVGKDIQPNQTHSGVYLADFDTCQERASFAVILKLKTTSNGSGTKRYVGCQTEIIPYVELYQADLFDPITPFPTPQKSLAPSRENTKPPLSTPPTLAPSLKPSIRTIVGEDPDDSEVSPSMAPSTSLSPSKGKSAKSSTPSMSRSPSSFPSRSSVPSTSIAPSKGTKSTCKKKSRVAVPPRCRADYDADPEPLHYRPKMTKTDVTNSVCRAAYIESSYSLFDSEVNDDIYSDTSELVASDLGLFKGLNEIQRYVGFFKDSTLFDISFTSTRSGEFDNILNIYSDENECVLTHAFVATMRTKAATDPQTMDVVIGVRTKFSIIEPGKISIRRNDVFVPRTFSKFFWGEALHTREIAFRNCNIMTESCAVEFRDNCYSIMNVDDCVIDMLALPGADRRGNVDGKSFGCRTFYSTFVGEDSEVCPSISYQPKFTSDCKLKCQNSSKLKNREMFLKEELDFFQDFSAFVGLGEDKWTSPSII
ncbi:hypothetical protein CTEN210_16843 [Chaetoceros tenuissimus]|uniref:Uncharacterized protein n=1 Tax=Chaetoceros tenuissimus TaxID=426638 RepID=A0AAD3DAB8_9STRA|nr:hypothetical protein CTEN210_16843 [Chaetoceros tenuissimus]